MNERFDTQFYAAVPKVLSSDGMHCFKELDKCDMLCAMDLSKIKEGTGGNMKRENIMPVPH